MNILKSSFKACFLSLGDVTKPEQFAKENRRSGVQSTKLTGERNILKVCDRSKFD